MHHIFFSLKRTHHRALAYSRQLSIPYGLTPVIDVNYSCRSASIKNAGSSQCSPRLFV